MAKRRPFLREWRKQQGLSQEKLADRMGIERSYLSKVESGKRRWDEPYMDAMAEALGIETGDLWRDPTQPVKDDFIVLLWKQISPRDREQAAKVLETFVHKKTGTNDR